MDYFNNVLTTLLGLERVYVATLLSMQGQRKKLLDFICILTCVPKMNEGLMGLEWHKVE